MQTGAILKVGFGVGGGGIEEGRENKNGGRVLQLTQNSNEAVMEPVPSLLPLFSRSVQLSTSLT
jgi:hypothetical protein